MIQNQRKLTNYSMYIPPESWKAFEYDIWAVNPNHILNDIHGLGNHSLSFHKPIKLKFESNYCDPFEKRVITSMDGESYDIYPKIYKDSKGKKYFIIMEYDYCVHIEYNFSNFLFTNKKDCLKEMIDAHEKAKNHFNFELKKLRKKVNE